MNPTADSNLLGLARGLGAAALLAALSLGTAALLAALVLGAAPARAADSDGDGWDDAIDTCSARRHPHLGDVDGDGFGDPCDCDFDNDGYCNISDFSIFLPDIIAGADGGSGTDMNGSGDVDYRDFLLFFDGFQVGAPGPGAVAGPGDPITAFPGVSCDSEGPTASCTIQLTPTILFEVLRDQLELVGVDLGVTGDVAIPTPTGPMWMLDVSLTIVPGDGPFGLETVRGTAVLENAVGGLLDDLDVTGAVVDVGFDLGANIVADVPLQPDLHYLFFMAQAGLLVGMGPFQIEGPGVATTLLFNPSDPFFYAGAEVANIPIPTPAGVLILSAGAGIGFSSQGWIPFEPNTSEGIAALFPGFDGHMVNQASGEFPSCAGCPTLTFDGYAITDLDPQEDGQLALFGPDTDVALGINGDFGLEGNLGLLSLSVDLFGATGGFESTDDDFVWFVGGRVGSRPDLFLLDVATEFELLPPAAGELGLGVLVSSDPSQSFFRFEGQGMIVGASGVEAATGVTVANFQSADFFFQTGGAGTFLGGSTTAQEIVAGVRALQEQSWQLSFPSDTKPELVLHSRYEIGTHQLRESTMWIGPLRIAHEGLLDTPNYTWSMYGEITRDGPLYRGTLEIPIPYSYPEVEVALQVADLISQREAEVAAAEAAAGQAADSLDDAIAALGTASSALSSAQTVFDAADDALQSNLDSIAYWDNYDCGCSQCQVWNVVCWSECGICEGSALAAKEYYELLTDGLQAAYDLARTGLLAAQSVFAGAQARLQAAQFALIAANLSLQDSLDALSALYQQRDSLPAEDGTFDATITLTLTETDLTGSVGGDFQGVPDGAGVVYFDDGPPRACFQPPVPGATEEFCTPL